MRLYYNLEDIACIDSVHIILTTEIYEVPGLLFILYCKLKNTCDEFIGSI